MSGHRLVSTFAESLEVRTLLSAPHPVDLGTLDGTNGFRLDGIDAGDLSGWSVSSAGDVNGDGFDDLIIGAKDADRVGFSNVGESYVVFGKSDNFVSTIQLSTLDGANGFRLDGIDAGDRSGRSVSSAGDVNGDGFDDLIIGASDAEQPESGQSTGESYVVFGKSEVFGSAIQLSTLDGTNGFRINGADANDNSGFSVSNAGDINGDGLADLAIGAIRTRPDSNFDIGTGYVVFGMSGSFVSAIDLGTLNGTNGFKLDGLTTNDLLGYSISDAGDINGDGYGDLIVGALGGNGQYGKSYVVLGMSSGFVSSINLSLLDGTTGFRIDGVDQGDIAGRSVSGAGDVNGDGFDDLIIGASGADPGGNSDAGESYLVFGKSSGFASALSLDTLDGTTGFRLNGIQEDDQSGHSVSRAGDVNGDGFDDVILGARWADPSGNSEAGESYVVFGNTAGISSSIDLSSLNGTIGFRLNGVDAGDNGGWSVSNAGDVNGDGFDDLIIGARNADPGGISNAGESYVVLGGNFTGGAETQVGDASGNVLTANQGTAATDVLIGGVGDDTLISDGGSDVLRGAEGDDTLALPDADFSSTRRLIGGNGTDTLRLDGTGLSLDLTTIPENRIVDIEVIDITGSGDNSLTLNFLEVVNISSTSNTLRVLRDAGDTVTIGDGWTQEDNQTIGSIVYEVFTQGSAVLMTQFSPEFGFSITESDSVTSVDESGPTDSIDVVLTAQPTSNVVLTVTSGNESEATVSASTLTFTSANWDSAQNVTISAVDDSAVDGNQNVSVTVTVKDNASDDQFDFVADQTVTVTTIDNEVIHVSLDGNGNLTIEDRSTDGLADNLTLLVVSNELLIVDPDNVLVTSTGTQVSDHEVRVPLAAVTNQRVVVNHNQGNDRLNAAGLGISLALEAAGGAGDDTITGSSLGDTISGGAGDDSIVAGDGDDVVDGGDGNDELDGGGGNDTLIVCGNSHLSITSTHTAGAGNDSHGGFEQAVLTAGTGNNRLDASGANIPVTLNGLDGNDTLLGGSGIDRLDGGDGVDFVEITGTNIVLTDASAPGADGDTLVSVEGLQLIAAGASSLIDASGYTLGPVTIVGSSGDDTLKGGAGNDVILAGNGSDVVTGGAGNDLIMGGAGNDSLSANDGDDTTSGGRGRDTIDGGLDADLLRGGSGSDTIQGGAGDDQMRGGSGRDDLRGDDGLDALVGGSGSDTLAGGLGDDTLEGSAGNDSVSGGGGLDRAVLTADVNFTLTDTLLTGFGNDTIDTLEVVLVTGGASANNIDATSLTLMSLIVFGEGGNDTIFGGALNDTMAGGDGEDFINGRNGNDLVSGDSGNDTLQGGTGVDFVDGGDGDDQVLGLGSSGDTLRGGPGNDTLDGGAGTGDIISEVGDVSFTLTTTQLTGLGTDSVLNVEGAILVGGASANALNVSAFGMPTTLTGGGGDDTITGGTATDVLIESGDVNFTLTDSGLTGLGTDSFTSIEQVQLSGGAGSNVLNASASSRPVTLSGGDGNDTLVGGSAADVLFGEAGDDQLTGNGGVDALIAGDGVDRLVESGDNDFTLGSGSLDGVVKDIINAFEEAELTGGASANTILVTTFVGSVTLYGGDGNDSLEGTSFDDVLDGQGGDDTLKGEDGNDTLDGGSGADNLLGGVGNDLINGGDGNDRLRGELGTDSLLTGDDTLNGDAGNDDIDGESGNDVVSGGADPDTVVGAAGDDSLLGDDGADLIYGGAGNDSIGGAGGADDLRGDEGDDTIFGGSENDILQGGVGNDSIEGDEGDDQILGDTGEDTLSGGGGNDLVDGDAGNDSLSGGDGNDRLRGIDGDDTIVGDAGQDSLLGMLGNDSLDGGAGSDIVLGDLGNDTVLGGEDRDVVIGDHGSDSVNGGDDDDLVTGSSYRFDDDLVSLAQLLADWNAGSSYTARATQLEDDDYAYQWKALALLTDSGTLYDDYALDTVNGGSGQDYFGRPGEPTLATTDLTPDRDAGLETLNVSVFGNADPGFFPTDMTEPDYLATINDPTFGTPTTRITGDPGTQMTLPINIGGTATITWSGAVRTRYVTDSSWNIDGSLMLLRSYDPAMTYHIMLDGDTHQPLYLASIPTSNYRWSQNPAKPSIQYGFPQLSTVDNDALGIDGSMAVLPEFGPDDDTFVEYNVVTGEVLRTIELPFNKLFSPKTTISFRDGHEYVALFGVDKVNPTSGISVYIVQLDAANGANPVIASFALTDGTSGTPEPANVNALDFSNLWFSPNGAHLLTLYGGSTVTTRSWRLLDVNYNTGTIAPHVIPNLTGDDVFQTNGDRTKGHFPVNWSHPVFTTSPDGDTYVVGVSGQFNNQPFTQAEITTSNGRVGSVLAFNVTDNSFHSLTDPTDENLATHVTATNTANPGYVFVTYWNDTTNPARGPKYSGEIVAIKLTDPFGTNGLVQLVHHRTSIANVNYYGNTLPTVSPDGTQLVFSSTWGEVQGSVSTYLLDLTTKLP